jgi:D-alanyl-D-alanine carboxypeptidase (penicillin-binding protein 5/6)
VLVAVVVLIVLSGVYAAVQLTRSVPAPTLRPVAVPSRLGATGAPAVLPWPHDGEAAVAVAGLGSLGTAGPSRSLPIASLAKVMTALIVLRDHPLKVGQTGPKIAITAADQATYEAESAVGDSVAAVTAGERLSELQLLQALLIPSADNAASVLAHWDAGSDGAFVTKMNSVAAKLGMRASHYADPSGLSVATVGTAADQLRLAEAAAANPVLMGIVREPVLTLPDGSTVENYDTLLGHDGVVGIKTGSTIAAGGCFMFSAVRVIHGQTIEVLGVVLGQSSTPLITAALGASQALITRAFGAVHPVTVVPAGTTVAEITTPWAPPVPVRTTRAVSLLAVPGMTVHVSVKLNPGWRPGTAAPAATVTATAGNQSQHAFGVVAGPVPAAPARWRLQQL